MLNEAILLLVIFHPGKVVTSTQNRSEYLRIPDEPGGSMGNEKNQKEALMSEIIEGDEDIMPFVLKPEPIYGDEDVISDTSPEEAQKIFDQMSGDMSGTAGTGHNMLGMFGGGLGGLSLGRSTVETLKPGEDISNFPFDIKPEAISEEEINAFDFSQQEDTDTMLERLMAEDQKQTLKDDFREDYVRPHGYYDALPESINEDDEPEPDTYTSSDRLIGHTEQAALSGTSTEDKDHPGGGVIDQSASGTCDADTCDRMKDSAVTDQQLDNVPNT